MFEGMLTGWLKLIYQNDVVAEFLVASFRLESPPLVLVASPPPLLN